MSRRLVYSPDLVALLQQKGLLPDKCQRVVIDANAREPVLLHYTVLADERLLEVVQDASIRIEEKPAEPPFTYDDEPENMP